MNQIRKNYNHTIYACYIGYITQAIINNFVPLLFVTFQKEYHISMDKIALLISINFGVQLIVDLLSPKIIHLLGERLAIIMAHFCSCIGLISLAFLPGLFSVPYIGLLISIICYAIGGGLIEVMVSPIVEACPTKRKEAVMSLLHSFYCWGYVGVVLLSTVYFWIIGINHWKALACIWAIIPFLNGFYFLFVPIHSLVPEGQGMTLKELLRQKMFWILFLIMICAGASEQGMSQWASAFAEAGLGVSKTIGDLAGPCTFALLMGVSRAFYGKYSEKLSLHKFMVCSSCLCILSYLFAGFGYPFLGLIGCALCGLSVGIMWPGTFSMGAAAMKRGGTIMFALFALAGDLGCSAGPGLVGIVSGSLADDLKKGILAVIIFPIALIIGIIFVQKEQKILSINEEVN